MNEEPIERLNYYNGQRLAAKDFEDEQNYHIRVRRWLNKSLFSAGIADGLEVRAQTDPNGNPTNSVVVSPGLALDEAGREIILLEEQVVQVVGRASKGIGQVEGNYLFLQYREQNRSEEGDSCPPNGQKRGQIAWGGPSRVRAAPVLGWSDTFPHESSGKIVLAQVELNEQCSVRSVYAYPRHYVGPNSLMTVRQYALEGERHIDPHNPGRIYFHIRGRQPNAVTLYLRAEKFSTLFYTEMGNHSHKLNVSLAGADGKHRHDIGNHNTQDVVNHIHNTVDQFIEHEPQESTFDTVALGALTGGISIVASWLTSLFKSIDSWKVAITPRYHFQLNIPNVINVNDFYPPLVDNNGGLAGGPITTSSNGQHHHEYGTVTDSNGNTIVALTGNNDANSNHTHAFSQTGANQAGVLDIHPPDYSARGGNPANPPDAVNNIVKPLTYIDHLQIYIGKVDVDGRRPISGINNQFTDEILAQLKNTQPTIYQNRQMLGEGNGDANDPLYYNGTGPIRLDLVSPKLAFPEGEYYIDLKVTSGGGRIVYNLYVE